MSCRGESTNEQPGSAVITTTAAETNGATDVPGPELTGSVSAAEDSASGTEARERSGNVYSTQRAHQGPMWTNRDAGEASPDLAGEPSALSDQPPPGYSPADTTHLGVDTPGQGGGTNHGFPRWSGDEDPSPAEQNSIPKGRGAGGGDSDFGNLLKHTEQLAEDLLNTRRRADDYEAKYYDMMRERDGAIQNQNSVSAADGKYKAGVEDAMQRCRYMLKYQDYPVWNDMSEYQKGFTVACGLCENSIGNLTDKEGM